MKTVLPNPDRPLTLRLPPAKGLVVAIKPVPTPPKLPPVDPDTLERRVLEENSHFCYGS